MDYLLLNKNIFYKFKETLDGVVIWKVWDEDTIAVHPVNERAGRIVRQLMLLPPIE